MHYKKIAPSADLAPFVECYFEWEGNAPERLDIQSPPNPRGAIVFNYGDPARAYQHNSPEQTVPESFVCGPLTSGYYRIMLGKIGVFGIVFHAHALHNLFGLRMSTLVNNRMPLDLLIGEQAAPLANRIKLAKDGEERARIAMEWLRPQLIESRKRISIIDEAVDLIIAKDGLITIEDVAAHFKISKRYLEKQFLVKVGVSPKFFARLRRFDKISRKVANAESIDWQDLANEAGFHDQSHMVKEFLEFNKSTPGHYLESHSELSRLVKKK